MLRISLIGGILILAAHLSGQSGNLVVKRIAASDTITVFDRPPITSTLRLSHASTLKPISNNNYSISDTAVILIPDSLRTSGITEKDSLILQYRLIPLFLTESYSHLDTSGITFNEENLVVGGRLDIFQQKDQNALIDIPRLDYGGSFSRGFSVGNNQSLVLNSALNLQMQGDLGDGIGIAAAISDNNIPIQPEGNTRQIQEFDKVFIQLTKAPHTIVAGDFEIAKPPGYFTQYYKKLKGINYFFDGDVGENRLSLNASAAIARGKFSRNFITALEGNQGPYKLTGSNNERFIIVLSGSERVYLDGELLIRGLEEDYIIDYNRGEITFTRRRLITKDNRIIVEFEYAEQNYNRTHTTANGTYTGEKFKLYFNLYNEQDSKTATGDLDLTTEEKMILRDSGDELDDAVSSTIRMPEDGFSTNRIMYTIRDTTANGQTYADVLIYSTNPEEALFTATFSDLGPGNGNYVLEQSTAANGRVYKWVAPDPATGLPRGQFEPIAQLVAPQSRQIFSFGGSYTLTESLSYSGEIALSNTDLNRFSSLGDGDNTGLALKNSLNKIFELEKAWSIEVAATYEYVQQDFRALNPFRNAEFNRDWSLPQSNFQSQVTEHLPGGSITLRKEALGFAHYNYSGLYRQDSYSGTRNGWELFLDRSGWKLSFKGNILEASSDSIQSTFYRPQASLSKTFLKLNDLSAGISYLREENRREDLNTLFLRESSFLFDIYQAFLRNSELGDFHWSLLWERRDDKTPFDDRFVNLTKGEKFKVLGRWQIAENRLLSWDFTYRDLLIQRKDLTQEVPAHTLLGKLDYQASHWKGALRTATNYELSTGQEPRLEYRYVEVQPGEGDYIWVDDGDGVEELNEFEIAPFPDQANYIRLNALNDAFVKTQGLTVNQSVRFNLQPLLYGKEGKLTEFFARFALLSSVKYSRKTLAGNDEPYWSPFYSDFQDTSIVSLSRQWRNILYFNQSDPVYDIQLGQTLLSQKLNQTIGSEERSNDEYFARLRWNLTKSLSFVIQGTAGLKTLESERFDNRDYRIERLALEPELTYLLSTNLRIIGKYNLSDLQNTLAGGEQASIHNFELEGTYRKSESFSIRSGVSYARVKFDGQENSPIEFAMLEGLKTGGNILWNAQLDIQMSKAILFTLRYDGRKTGDNPIVHTGNAQVRASF